MDKLRICKQTRKIASDSLYKALKKLFKSKKPISEVMLRDRWLLEMRRNKNIFSDGWYIPPPHGIGVLFSTDEDFERIKFKTLRAKEYWSKEDVFLDKKNGFILLYASPVAKNSFIIGDFGLNIYFGKNKKIQSTLSKHLELVKKIFNYATVGMNLSKINQYADKLFKSNGFANDWWVSTTDPTGTNYGHTVPGTESFWTNDEQKVLKGSKNWEGKIKIISQKRKFTNATEEAIIRSDMGLTIEPRVLRKGNITFPNLYFHTIALFHSNGKKELLTNFDKIFKLAGMDYMLKTI